MAQWIRHRPTEPGIAGSSPAGVIVSWLHCYEKYTRDQVDAKIVGEWKCADTFMTRSTTHLEPNVGRREAMNKQLYNMNFMDHATSSTNDVS